MITLGLRSWVFPAVVTLAGCLVIALLKIDGNNRHFFIGLAILTIAGFFVGGWLDKREEKKDSLGKIRDLRPFDR